MRTGAEKGHAAITTAVLAHGEYLYTGGEDCAVRQYSALTGVLVAELKRHRGTVAALVAGRSADEVISAGTDGVALLWAHGKVKHTFTGHRAAITHAALHDGLLYTSSHDKTLCAWDLATGEATQTFRGHRHGVKAFCVEGNALFSVSSAALLVWDKKSNFIVPSLPAAGL